MSRARLCGWRARSARRAGWWQASDGRWYPPAAARHPAARFEPAAPTDLPPGRFPLTRGTWFVLIAPLALVLLVVAGTLVATSRSDKVETFGPDDPPPSTAPTPPTTAEPTTTSLPTDPDDPADPTSGPATGPGTGPHPHGQPPAVPDPGNPSGGLPAPGGEARGGAPIQDQLAESTSNPEPGDDSEPLVTPDSPPPAVPDSTDDCLGDGWTRHTDDQGRPFTTQGQCIAYVNGRPPTW